MLSRLVNCCLLVFGVLAATPAFAQDQAGDLLDRDELTRYRVVRLKADLDHLEADQKKMLVQLMEAADRMDECFWFQALGDRKMFTIEDPDLQRHFQVNYGPWDRLKDNRPFLPGVGPRPAGANFYPRDMTREEFETHLKRYPDSAASMKSLYTFIRRGESGELRAIDYSLQLARPFQAAAGHLRAAADLATDGQFAEYLRSRAEALLSNQYRDSDMLWMDMKDNEIDCVIGPIETYEDQLFGYKAACECYVLVKDMEWSQRLAKYAALLPELQKNLPVDDRYKQEEPGTDSDLNAYDVIYYAGDCNAGSKTIAINLPNDEQVQLQKGTRRLQLKNAMRAKYDEILVPLADVLIVEDQRQHITFDAFFANTMFHEVAHGLGIKYTVTDGSRVRDALKEHAAAIEEGKADILGLYMVTRLLESGELTQGQLEDYYVTFMASIFRSVRFGASSAHGKANMLRFNFFRDMGAFTREPSGQYRINIEKLKQAMTALTRKILQLQGDGDYEATARFIDEMASVGPQLQADLERVNRAGIPTDIVFQQGPAVLGLE
jgi:hypothetical protein